jgi:hypothetical protein
MMTPPRRKTALENINFTAGSRPYTTFASVHSTILETTCDQATPN